MQKKYAMILTEITILSLLITGHIHLNHLGLYWCIYPNPVSEKRYCLISQVTSSRNCCCYWIIFSGFNKLILHFPCAVTAASRALTIADLALGTTRQPELYILWSQYNHTLPCPTLIFTVWVPVCATAPPVRLPAKASAILNVSVTAVTASRFSPVHFKPHQPWNVFLIFTLTHIHAVNSVAWSLLYIDAIVASMYQGSLPGGKWNIRCNGNDKIDDQKGGYRQHNISFCCNKTLVPRNQLSPYRKRLMFESHGTGTSIFWITLRFDGHIWASPTKSNRSLMQRLQHPHLPRARHRHGIHVIYLY